MTPTGLKACTGLSATVEKWPEVNQTRCWKPEVFRWLKDLERLCVRDAVVSGREERERKPEGHPNTVRETLAVMSSYRQTVETVSLVTDI